MKLTYSLPIAAALAALSIVAKAQPHSTEAREYIAEQKATAAQKAALRQYARAVEKTTEPLPADEAKLQLLASEYSAAETCVRSRYPDEMLEQRVAGIRVLLLHPSERYQAHAKFRREASKLNVESPRGSGCQG